MKARLAVYKGAKVDLEFPVTETSTFSLSAIPASSTPHSKRAMKTHVEISRASVADAGAILALQKVAYQSEAALYEDWSMPPLMQSVQDIRSDFDNMTFLKASRGEEIVGSVRVSKTADTRFIGRLIVHPSS